MFNHVSQSIFIYLNTFHLIKFHHRGLKRKFEKNKQFHIKNLKIKQFIHIIFKISTFCTEYRFGHSVLFAVIKANKEVW